MIPKFNLVVHILEKLLNNILGDMFKIFIAAFCEITKQMQPCGASILYPSPKGHGTSWKKGQT